MEETSETQIVSTGIALTPRILAGMLTGGNVMGVNWAARFAQIPDGDVFENAMVPIISEKMAGGDDILAALLPPQILSELTADESVIDLVRDGEWPVDVLDRVVDLLVADHGEACEEIYARCARLMSNANTVIFHFNANYVMHILTVSNLDNAYVRKAAQLYERFAETDPAGALFGLFMLSLLGPARFDRVTKRLQTEGVL